MLRSFSYVTAGAELLRGVEAPEGWEERARERFLDRATTTPWTRACCRPGQQATEQLLAVFELEKAVYELRYELNNRPDWVGIPVAGIRPAARLGVEEMHMSDADRLIARQHANPHAYLGAHPENGSVVVRAFRPAAAKVERRRGPTASTRRSSRSIPAASSRATSRAPSCRSPTSSRSTTASPGTITIDDPYRFLPTIGELDVHLLGEGRHEELWERLGAHVREIDGVARHRRSPSGRRPRARCRSSATSTTGTAASTRCARSAPPASGSCSCPAWARARATSTRSSRRTARSA